MAVTANSIITPQAPRAAHCAIGATGLVSRFHITGTTGLTLLAAAGTNGTQINSILIKAEPNTNGVNTASVVYVWEYDGTTSWIVDEIQVTTTTPSTTAPSFQTRVYYSGWIIPINHSIYVSNSINTATTALLMAQLLGGDL